MASKDTMYNFNQPDKKQEPNRKYLVYIIIFILITANIWFLIQFMRNDSKFSDQQKAYNTVILEKDSLNAELQQIASDFDKVKQENILLQNKLVDKNTEIQSKVAEIRKLLSNSDTTQYHKAFLEMAKLRELNAKYIATINLLSSQNKELSNQNKDLNDKNANLASTLSQEKDKSMALAQKNEALTVKINAGAAIKIQKINPEGVKLKANGVEVKTDKAKATEKIKTCFTLLENPLTDKGSKTIYLRIVGPDGNALSTISQTITYRGMAINFTAKQTINFDNRETEICFYWTKGAAYDKGAYTAEIYSEGNQLGIARFSLN
jgi:hypothetical protein